MKGIGSSASGFDCIHIEATPSGAEPSLVMAVGLDMLTVFLCAET